MVTKTAYGRQLRTLCLRPTSILTLSVALTASLLAQPQNLTVSAMMDICRAGGYNDSSGATPPAVCSFPAKAGQRIMFSKVVGFWAGVGGQGPWGPRWRYQSL